MARDLLLAFIGGVALSVSFLVAWNVGVWLQIRRANRGTRDNEDDGE